MKKTVTFHDDDDENDENEEEEEEEEEMEEDEGDAAAEKRRRKTNFKYADAQQNLMDDPNRWFHLVVIASPIPMHSKKQQTAEAAANKQEEEEEEEASCEHFVKEYTELTFFIDGFPIRTTVTTRRPAGRIRCVGNSFDGLEPWGAIADFRLYVQ
jgi:hypothetical protein